MTDDINKALSAMAGLADAIKRLERAILADNIDDRAEYVAEAAKKRDAAEYLIQKAINTNPYGYCPKCFAPGRLRERRPNGNDRCQNGHTYPSRDAIPNKP